MITRLLLLVTFIFISTAKIQETSGFVTVAIAASNDIHGSAFPTTLYRSDTNETYNYGGLVYMASMIETLRR
jgi:2',3'-cyclic-nucleotide 2'-phosphodiesterase (5'-nucleotidase family)